MDATGADAVDLTFTVPSVDATPLHAFDLSTSPSDTTDFGLCPLADTLPDEALIINPNGQPIFVRTDAGWRLIDVESEVGGNWLLSDPLLVAELRPLDGARLCVTGTLPALRHSGLFWWESDWVDPIPSGRATSWEVATLNVPDRWPQHFRALPVNPKTLGSAFIYEDGRRKVTLTWEAWRGWQAHVADDAGTMLIELADEAYVLYDLDKRSLSFTSLVTGGIDHPSCGELYFETPFVPHSPA